MSDALSVLRLAEGCGCALASHAVQSTVSTKWTNFKTGLTKWWNDDGTETEKEAEKDAEKAAEKDAEKAAEKDAQKAGQKDENNAAQDVQDVQQAEANTKDDTATQKHTAIQNNFVKKLKKSVEPVMKHLNGRVKPALLVVAPAPARCSTLSTDPCALRLLAGSESALAKPLTSLVTKTVTPTVTKTVTVTVTALARRLFARTRKIHLRPTARK